MVKGCFIGLPQNRKGYMVSDSQNPLRVYVSCDVTFVEIPETFKHMTIQIDRRVPKCEEIPINVKARPESNSEIEKFVTEGNNAKEQSEGGDVMETAVKDTPIQLCQSMRTKHAPTQDDDLWYSVISYSRWKGPRESEEPQNTALVIKDPVTYEEAMLRNNAVYWKKACAEELKAFIKQELFSIVPKPVEHKVIECKWVFKTKLNEDGQMEYYKAWLVAQGFS